jgi:hypothetical protein
MSQPHGGGGATAPASTDFGATTISSGAPAAGASAPPAGPTLPDATTGTGASAAGTKGRSARSRGPRRARLQLRHINPLTVLRFSCVLAVALFFVWMIVVGVLFGILDTAGVISHVNDTITTINGPGSNSPVTPGIVFGGAAIVGVIDIVLFVALATVGSVIYNLCADLVGGIEITLSER